MPRPQPAPRTLTPDPLETPMTRPRLQWNPDDGSAAILRAYARRREGWRSVLRRALRLVAQADGILDSRGHIRRERRQP